MRTPKTTHNGIKKPPGLSTGSEVKYKIMKKICGLVIDGRQSELCILQAHPHLPTGQVSTPAYS